MAKRPAAEAVKRLTTAPARSRRKVTDAYAAQTLALLAERLDERLGQLRAGGRDPAEFGSPAELAERMVAALPSPHPWDEQIGPFFDTPGLCALLGVTKQAVGDRVRRRTLLGVTTRDGHVLYPVFQLHGRELARGMREVFTALRTAPVDGWVIAAWLTTPAPALAGSTPTRWLSRGGDIDRVVALAEDAAARWVA